MILNRTGYCVDRRERCTAPGRWAADQTGHQSAELHNLLGSPSRHVSDHRRQHNGHGSLMLNFRSATSRRALRDDGQIHQRLHPSLRDRTGQFPFPTNYGNAAFNYCNRAMFRMRRSLKTTRTPTSSASFLRGQLCWSNRPIICPLPATSCISRIDADGYNNYQARQQRGDLSALRHPRAVLHSFHLGA